ncbi:hypothetical protein SBF1_110053 [Candidatus Desulfosporosinus infrequens]|uniref:Uncharacterized protein n=1 Tax=Candidatus Desulfosporosinus infrequens TaxID=2043169 RepID=A0A2U3JX90_9FIRM|nr:hypothetical protein SBF1_110053 [Candidatus Desulfosporosinus infrequens]
MKLFSLEIPLTNYVSKYIGLVYVWFIKSIPIQSTIEPNTDYLNTTLLYNRIL